MAPKKAKASDVAGTSTGKRLKKVGASSSNPHGIVFKDGTQGQKYELLGNRKMVPTRYPHILTLQLLGIDDNVNQLLANLGWLDFLEIARCTYEGITLEFLSSLCFFEDRSDSGIPNRKLSFRLFNVDFNLSLTEFCELLGFKNEGFIHDSRHPEEKPEGFCAKTFWAELTGKGHYEARAAKASSIHNPVFRYVHRVMACTIFGRGEAGVVRVAELFILWAMVNGYSVNTCYYLISHLASIAEHGRGLTVVGGMVTYIAEKLGLDGKLDDLEEVEGNMHIDLELCSSMQMIKQSERRRDRYYLLISRQRSILLPDNTRTDIRNKANWLYPVTDGVNQQEEPVQGRDEEMADQGVQENSNFNMQAWCARIEAQQERHGEELQLIRQDQLYHSQQMEHMSDMLRTMMQHFSINQAPPPGQQ